MISTRAGRLGRSGCGGSAGACNVLRLWTGDVETWDDGAGVGEIGSKWPCTDGTMNPRALGSTVLLDCVVWFWRALSSLEPRWPPPW